MYGIHVGQINVTKTHETLNYLYID